MLGAVDPIGRTSRLRRVLRMASILTAFGLVASFLAVAGPASAQNSSGPNVSCMQTFPPSPSYGVLIEWDAYPGGSEYYFVHRRTVEDADGFPPIHQELYNLYYHDDDVIIGQSYEYGVSNSVIGWWDTCTVTILLAPADATAPQTTVDSATAGGGGAVTDGGSSGSTSMTFVFSGTDDAGVTGFACSLDGAVFTSCTSPQTYIGLAPGSHSFAARARDAAGNVDPTPATFGWTVTSNPDTTAPTTVIDSAVDGTGATVAPGASTTSTSLTMAFHGTDNVGVASFECSLDGSAYSACTSPRALTSLAVGVHTFEVRALDAEGNVDQTPASFQWTVTSSSLPVPSNMAVAMIDDLQERVKALPMPSSVKTKLLSQLEAAEAKITDANASIGRRAGTPGPS